jgi:hypothetical protein
MRTRGARLLANVHRALLATLITVTVTLLERRLRKALAKRRSA